MTQHATPLECAQATKIDSFGKSIARLDLHINSVNLHMERSEEHMRRTAIALENLAAQGVLISTHENRLGRHDTHIEEIFGRLRTIETIHAKDEVIEQVESNKEKFWSEVKLKFASPATLLWMFFILWVLDRSEFFVKLLALWKEFK